jgi:hypothetical protein
MKVYGVRGFSLSGLVTGTDCNMHFSTDTTLGKINACQMNGCASIVAYKRTQIGRSSSVKIGTRNFLEDSVHRPFSGE